MKKTKRTKIMIILIIICILGLVGVKASWSSMDKKNNIKSQEAVMTPIVMHTDNVEAQ